MRKKMRMPRGNRRGMSMVYTVILMSVMVGLVSLVVDLGRYQAAHNEMYGAVLAAARAGAYKMTSGYTTANSAATTVATANKSDGSTIASGNVTTTFGFWDTSAKTFTAAVGQFTLAQVPATVNACKVSISYSVPLTFGRVIGISAKTATESSIAMVSVQTDAPFVYATGDIWLANEPTGTTASQPDPNYSTSHPDPDHKYPGDIAGPVNKLVNGSTNSVANYSVSEPYSSPVKVGFTVRPGATITVTNCSGTSSYDHDTTPYVDATGNTGGTSVCDNAKAAVLGGSEHGISDATMPIGSMNAVFTGVGVPDSIATVPASLDFSTQAERDYVTLQPKLQQAFYTGTGSNSSGAQQTLVVPPGASYLFLGVMDAWEWDNNSGGFNCTITQIYVTTVQ